MTIQFLRYIVSVAEIGLGMAVDINTLYNPYHKIVTKEDGTQEEVIERQQEKLIWTGRRTSITR